VLENLQQIMKNYYASQEEFSDGWKSGKVERWNSGTVKQWKSGKVKRLHV